MAGIVRPLKKTSYTPETCEEYWAMDKEGRDEAKDRGGFEGGSLKDGRRKIRNVECRSLVTHDVASPEEGFIERFTGEFRNAAVVYTTHSHTPERPRYP